eukprot:gene25716-11373_t
MVAAYDLASNQWILPVVGGAPLPQARSSHRAVALSDRIVMHGGAAAETDTDRRCNLIDTLRPSSAAVERLRRTYREPGCAGTKRQPTPSLLMFCGYAGNCRHKYSTELGPVSTTVQLNNRVPSPQSMAASARSSNPTGAAVGYEDTSRSMVGSGSPRPVQSRPPRSPNRSETIDLVSNVPAGRGGPGQDQDGQAGTGPRSPHSPAKKTVRGGQVQSTSPAPGLHGEAAEWRSKKRSRTTAPANPVEEVMQGGERQLTRQVIKQVIIRQFDRAHQRHPVQPRYNAHGLEPVGAAAVQHGTAQPQYNTHGLEPEGAAAVQRSTAQPQYNIHGMETEGAAAVQRGTVQPRYNAHGLEPVVEAAHVGEPTLADSNRQIAESNRQITEANRYLTDANRQLTDANLQFQEANRQLEATNQTLEESNCRFESELEVVRGEEQRLLGVVKEIEADVVVLRSNLASTRQQLGEAKRDLHTRNQELISSRQEASFARTAREELQRTLSLLSDDLETHRVHLREKEAALAGAMRTNSDISDELSNAQRQRERVEQMLADSVARLEERRKDMEAQKEAQLTAQDTINSMSKLLRAAQTKAHSLKDALADALCQTAHALEAHIVKPYP